MVDEERVVRLLERIAADATFLDGFASRRPEDLLLDDLAMSALKYRFVTAIQGCAKVPITSRWQRDGPRRTRMQRH